MKKLEDNIPPCDRRKYRDGIAFCYAIGICEVGDCVCECFFCKRKDCPKKHRAKPKTE